MGETASKRVSSSDDLQYRMSWGELSWRLFVSIGAAAGLVLLLIVLSRFGGGLFGTAFMSLFGLALAFVAVGASAASVLVLLVRKETPLRPRAWLTLTGYFAVALVSAFFLSVWLSALSRSGPNSSPFLILVPLIAAGVLWSMLAGWYVRGRGTCDQGPPTGVAERRGRLLALISPAVAVAAMVCMVFAKDGSGSENNLEVNGPLIAYYGLFVIGMTLIAAAGGWKDSRLLVWPAAVILIAFAVIGSFTIGVYISVPALIVLSSAILMGLKKQTANLS